MPVANIRHYRAIERGVARSAEQCHRSDMTVRGRAHAQVRFGGQADAIADPRRDPIRRRQLGRLGELGAGERGGRDREDRGDGEEWLHGKLATPPFVPAQPRVLSRREQPVRRRRRRRSRGTMTPMRWAAIAMMCACGGTTTPRDRPPENIAFATSTVQTGNLGGLDGADMLCTRLAHDAGLDGTYVAWLSVSTTTAFSRVQQAPGWVAVDGTPIAETASDLASGGILSPLAL